MATILPDSDIAKLIGSVIQGADARYLNPNGIELRLGKWVHFISTDEERELSEDSFLQVNPGETVAISSLESIDFREKTTEKVLPDCTLMGLVTPTTTMMREGISEVATKVDAGFYGVLNWGLRNGSTKRLILKYGEPIFKLTILSLGEGERPEQPYGARERDSYQGSDKIVRSRREIPASLPESKIVRSSFEELNAREHLREAGYPFDHISKELERLDGRFEFLKDNVTSLRDDIANNANVLSSKIDSTQRNTLTEVRLLLSEKVGRMIAIVLGGATTLYGLKLFLEKQELEPTLEALSTLVAGLIIIAVGILLTNIRKGTPE